jgi:hypothetical protein
VERSTVVWDACVEASAVCFMCILARVAPKYGLFVTRAARMAREIFDPRRNRDCDVWKAP